MTHSTAVNRDSKYAYVCLWIPTVTINAQKASPDGNGGGGGGNVVTVVNVSSSGSPSSYGGNVTFTGSISPSSCATNSTNAVFYDNGSSIGNSSWGSNGLATLTISSLAVASHAITVRFNGSVAGTTTCLAETSPPITQVVNRATPSLSVSCSPNPITYGSQTTTCTSTLSGGSSPTGNESWTINGGAWTTTAVNGSASGLAGYSVGSYTIGVTYSGDVNNNSASASKTLTISKSGSSTSVSCTPNPITYGSQNTTCKVNVSSSSGGTATGTVALYYNGSGNYWTTVTLSGGTASATGYAGDSAGSYSVIANYSGDANDNTSSGSSTVTIQKATPSLSVSCSPNPILYGSQNTACTSSIGGGTTGTETWTINGSAWTSTGLNGSAGGFAGWNDGNYTIGVTYSGDSNNNSVSASTTLTIGKANSSTSVSCSPNPVSYGQNTTCKVNVSSGSGGSATGTVALYSNGSGTYWTTVTLSNGSASATGYGGTAAGSYPLIANYSGDGNNNTSSGTTTVNIVQYDAGTVTLTVGGTQVASASYGQASTPATVAASLAGSYSNASVQAVDNILYIEASTLGSDPSYSLAVTTSYPTVFSSPSFSGSPSSGILQGGAPSGGSAQTVYSYLVNFDTADRITGYSDAVMGTWANITYDSVNRQLSTQNTVVTNAAMNYAGKYICWSYDSFGNRLAQSIQASACPTPESNVTPTASYNANNQVTWTTVNAAANGFAYDPSGNGDVLNDNANQYLYDGEGRICAVKNLTVGTVTGYIYNAEGIRVSKGSLTRAFNCDFNPSDPNFNGFQPNSDYVLGPSGEQAAELDMDPTGKMAWQHSNAWADGQLIATYDPDGLHFYANDWQGSRRIQTDYAGVVEQTCASLPFGDELTCTGSTTFPTEHHFTGKERDSESGNDYFEARYYQSSMGRFVTPDWDAKPIDVPYASFGDPQTLNLYAYVENGPLNRVDADGHSTAETTGLAGNSQLDEGMFAQGGPCAPNFSAFNPCEAASDGTARNIFDSALLAQDNQASASTGNSAARDAQAQQQKTDNLSNVVENETSSLKADPNAKPGQPGSAENLAAGQLAVAEVANRVIDAGHPDRVASSTLYDSEAAGLKKGDPAAVDAHNRSRTAAEAAVNGSNTTNGATQYRTRVGSNVTTPLGRSKTNPGTPVSMSFGPFIEGKHTVVIVVAP